MNQATNQSTLHAYREVSCGSVCNTKASTFDTSTRTSPTRSVTASAREMRLLGISANVGLIMTLITNRLDAIPTTSMTAAMKLMIMMASKAFSVTPVLLFESSTVCAVNAGMV